MYRTLRALTFRCIPFPPALRRGLHACRALRALRGDGGAATAKVCGRPRPHRCRRQDVSDATRPDIALHPLSPSLTAGATCLSGATRPTARWRRLRRRCAGALARTGAFSKMYRTLRALTFGCILFPPALRRGPHAFRALRALRRDGGGYREGVRAPSPAPLPHNRNQIGRTRRPSTR
jgi:hypothetical protein